MKKEKPGEEVLSGSKPLNLDFLAKGLEKGLFGKNLIFRESIGSTNVFLKSLAREGAPEGTVVIADEQRAGLGRLGRQWVSKKRENLLFSVLLRPHCPPTEVFVLTMIFALAGIEAVEVVSGVNAMIKWPNDIYVGEKKLGGMLTEFAVSEGSVEHVVLGMGLNVNWNPSGEGLVQYGTSSIFAETQKRVPREPILLKLLKTLEIYYSLLPGNQDQREWFYRKWNGKSLILGKSVVIATGSDRVEGIASRIERDGALTVRTSDGEERKFLCGDVSLKMN